MHKNIQTIVFLIFFLSTFSVFSQIVIDNFDDNTNINWVPGSSKYTLSESAGVLSISANGTGANFEGFGKTFPSINMSKHSVITMKIMVPTGEMAPRIRLDVGDNNGYDSNKFPVLITTVADGIYHEYSFNFSGKFQASWPASVNLVAEKISRLYFYTSSGVTGTTHTGTFYIDDITLNNAQSSSIIAQNSTWKYYNNGAVPSSDWMDKGYDDSGWFTDSAEFGFGDGDEQTILGYGSDANNKYTTTYFRKTFHFIDTAVFKNVILNYLVDDGMVIYLNGSEIHRDNMPLGSIDYSTLASSELTDNGIENAYRRIVLSEAILDSGENVIAIEVHQASASSEDLSFNLFLTGTDYKTGLIRGPYLQCLSDTSVVIRWRTLEKTDSEVKYGSAFSSLTHVVSDLNQTTEHEISIIDLTPGTKYYYSLGTTSTVLSGEDEEHHFVTAPSNGTISPVRIWVTGDAGKYTYEQRSVRDSYYNYSDNKHTDAWLLLGDNAYNEGTDDEYQLAMFENMFEAKMRNTALWPTPGNHDLRSYMNAGDVAPYYNIFTTPINGESGGVASGTEGYYSFDYANIHFISLDSYGNSRDSTEGMANWLKADLAATNQKWKIAFWHHPPYSKGSNDSEGSGSEDLKNKEMKEQILPILEKYGVDLVLNGHSHNYERSHLIHGHYAHSSTFLDQPHILNAQNSGKKSMGEEYYKNPVHSILPDKGTVYSVVGCSGLKSSSVKWLTQPTNNITNALMYTSMNQFLGSMVIEIHKDTLVAKFIDNYSNVRDDFTIIKDNTKEITLITASNPTSVKSIEEIVSFNIFPNPTTEEAIVRYSVTKTTKVELEIINESGKVIEKISLGKKAKGDYEYQLNLTTKENGIYILHVHTDKGNSSKKIIKLGK